jgi:hypothetical protein
VLFSWKGGPYELRKNRHPELVWRYENFCKQQAVQGLVAGSLGLDGRSRLVLVITASIDEGRKEVYSLYTS